MGTKRAEGKEEAETNGSQRRGEKGQEPVEDGDSGRKSERKAVEGGRRRPSQ